MREISRTESALLLAGAYVSITAVLWFSEYGPRPSGLAMAIGEWCTLASVLALFTVCFALRTAASARKGNWSPQRCQWFFASPYFMLFAFFAGSKVRGALPLIILAGILAGMWCRKLTYPDLPAEEAYRESQELHIFQK